MDKGAPLVGQTWQLPGGWDQTGHPERIRDRTGGKWSGSGIKGSGGEEKD